MISNHTNFLTCLLVVFSLCGLSAIAHAQTEPSIQPLSSLTLLNADNCTSELSEQLTLQAEHTGSTSDNHTMKIVFFTESKDCLADVSECPDTFLDINTGEACGCLDSFTVNNANALVSTSINLGDDAELVELLCASDRTLTFSVSVQLDAEGTEPVYTQNPVNLTIDVVAPEAPTIKPNLGSGEESLTVSLAGSEDSDDDVTAHEVCYAKVGSIQPPADCSINDTLSAEEKSLRLYCGFSATENCRQTDDLINGEYRLSGLQNGAEYQVVVAALDDAGNRSANSPSNTAKPADFIDFAEGYSSVFGDGTIGETGGCSTHTSHLQPWFFLAVALLGIRRKRC